MKRITDGLLSVFYSLRKIPSIRYLGTADSCNIVADKLT